jgi:hypothetical protein
MVQKLRTPVLENLLPPVIKQSGHRNLQEQRAENITARFALAGPRSPSFFSSGTDVKDGAVTTANTAVYYL